MKDPILRHMVAIAATGMCLFAYMAGYVSGGSGWWWTGFAALIVYGGVFKLVNK